MKWLKISILCRFVTLVCEKNRPYNQKFNTFGLFFYSPKCWESFNKKYLLNKDGFVFLAFGFTGKEVDAWKWKYIDAFNRMERLVYEKNTAAYQIADQEERITRRAETDVIKEFVEYARAQGSTHADHYYSNYTRLAYKSVGITDKTTAAGSQLDDLSLVEHLIAHTLRTGMAAGRNYKDIYQDCKNRLEAMRYIQCTA